MKISEKPSTVQPHLALFNLAFRPFFLGAGLYAVLSMVAWMGVYVFHWQLSLLGLQPMNWHAHEMLFGYALAVIAGLLLTAVKNWTGIQTLRGYRLALLFALWAGARLLFLAAGQQQLFWAAVLDTLFLLFLIVAVLMPLIRARQWKQLGLVAKLVLILLANVAFYLGALNFMPEGIRWGLYSALYFILGLIFVMGRRVIPFFIEKGIAPEKARIHNWRWLDLSSLGLFMLFWIADVFTDFPVLTGWLALLLFLLHGIRLWGWHDRAIWRKPLLWVLYLAYVFITAGFALKAAAVFFSVSPYLAVHAFAFGGIGMMTLGMMVRVTLGHTGRNVLEPPRLLFFLFLLMYLGAVVRVVLPLLFATAYTSLVFMAHLIWIMVFVIFLVMYLPMLVAARIDGRAG